MEAVTDIIPAAKAKRGGRYTERKLNRKLNRLSFAAADCLAEILKDGEVKPADRIAAAKLTFEVVARREVRPDPEDGEENLLRVVFTDMPREYAE